MVDLALSKVVIVRKRNRIWRMFQFVVVGLVTIIALMNVFVWQYVVDGIGTAVLILIAFLYFVSFLECFNYYHFNCPICGDELKTSDFENHFIRHCENCGNRIRVVLVDNS